MTAKREFNCKISTNVVKKVCQCVRQEFASHPAICYNLLEKYFKKANNYMKKFLLIIMTLFLAQSSIYAIGAKSTMEKVMGSWIGEHIDSVINKWGYPTGEKKTCRTFCIRLGQWQHLNRRPFRN